MDLGNQAEMNITNRLSRNPYPGRGIVIGMNRTGELLVQIYWIMGRSANSRNRIFKLENDILKTFPKDQNKVTNPELIIYNAMQQTNGHFIVTNGVQTNTIVSKAQQGKLFEDALNEHSYEPDEPNFTPRIAGLIRFRENDVQIKLAIIKKSIFNNSSVHNFFNYASLTPGLGLCLHTYQNDSNPLPSFEGEPFIVPIRENIVEIANEFWQALNTENRISLAVQTIDTASRQSSFHIINK